MIPILRPLESHIPKTGQKATQRQEDQFYENFGTPSNARLYRLITAISDWFDTTPRGKRRRPPISADTKQPAPQLSEAG